MSCRPCRSRGSSRTRTRPRASDSVAAFGSSGRNLPKFGSSGLTAAGRPTFDTSVLRWANPIRNARPVSTAGSVGGIAYGINPDLAQHELQLVAGGVARVLPAAICDDSARVGHITGLRRAHRVAQHQLDRERRVGVAAVADRERRLRKSLLRQVAGLELVCRFRSCAGLDRRKRVRGLRRFADRACRSAARWSARCSTARCWSARCSTARCCSTTTFVSAALVSAEFVSITFVSALFVSDDIGQRVVGQHRVAIARRWPGRDWSARR